MSFVVSHYLNVIIFILIFIMQSLSLGPKSVFLSSLFSQLGLIYDSKYLRENRSYHLLKCVLV